MITPADIEYKEFTKAVRGYKEEEVDEFLDLIIVDMENLIRENKKLKAELEKAKSQVKQQASTETAVYETLEAAKSLMNDIAASAERRAEVLLKNAELEASLITREAKESISRLTDEGNRLRSRVETLRGRYRRLLEDELESINNSANDILAEFEKDFLNPNSQAAVSNREIFGDAAPAGNTGTYKSAGQQKQDLSKTIVNLRK